MDSASPTLALADPRGHLDIGDLASRAATSVRTISRLFPIETGLTFKAWRQRARIVLAIDRLSAGSPVAQVAADAGFASTAAFCFAFRQVTGATPSTFNDHATLSGGLFPEPVDPPFVTLAHEVQWAAMERWPVTIRRPVPLRERTAASERRVRYGEGPT